MSGCGVSRFGEVAEISADRLKSIINVHRSMALFCAAVAACGCAQRCPFLADTVA